MTAAWILLADLDDWIRLAVIIVFVLGPLLNHLGKKPQKNGRAGRAQGGNPPVAQQGKRAKGLAGEIERILKEAQQAAEDAMKKAEQQEDKRALPNAPAAKEPQVVVVQDPQPQTAHRRRAPLTSSVSEHVQEHIKSRPVSDRGKSLGRRIAQANERIEKRLHDAFDHELGGLEAVAGGPRGDDSDRGTGAANWQGVADTRAKEAEIVNLRRAFIYEMFHDREQLKNAFVLAEIINRPRADTLE